MLNTIKLIRFSSSVCCCALLVLAAVVTTAQGEENGSYGAIGVSRSSISIRHKDQSLWEGQSINKSSYNLRVKLLSKPHYFGSYSDLGFEYSLMAESLPYEAQSLRAPTDQNDPEHTGGAALNSNYLMNTGVYFNVYFKLFSDSGHPLKIYAAHGYAKHFLSGEAYLTHGVNRNSACQTGVDTYDGSFEANQTIKDSCEKANISKNFSNQSIDYGIAWTLGRLSGKPVMLALTRTNPFSTETGDFQIRFEESWRLSLAWQSNSTGP